jgi:hypothetical protein
MRQGAIAGELTAGPEEAEIMFLATGERDVASESPAAPAGPAEGAPE